LIACLPLVGTALSATPRDLGGVPWSNVSLLGRASILKDDPNAVTSEALGALDRAARKAEKKAKKKANRQTEERRRMMAARQRRK
jgi:hypothetical protein